MDTLLVTKDAFPSKDALQQKYDLLGNKLNSLMSL